jgi:hypothetical protein
VKLTYTGTSDDERWVCTLEAVLSGGPDDAMWTVVSWAFFGATPVAALVEAALWCRVHPTEPDDEE